MLNLWSLSWAKPSVWLKLPLPNRKILLKFWNRLTVLALQMWMVAGKKKKKKILKSGCRFSSMVFEEPSLVLSLSIVCLPSTTSVTSILYFLQCWEHEMNFQLCPDYNDCVKGSSPQSCFQPFCPRSWQCQSLASYDYRNSGINRMGLAWIWVLSECDASWLRVWCFCSSLLIRICVVVVGWIYETYVNGFYLFEHLLLPL